MHNVLFALQVASMASVDKPCVDSPLFDGEKINHVSPRDIRISGNSFRSILVGDFGVDTKEVLGDAYLDNYNVPRRDALAQQIRERIQQSNQRVPDFALNVGDSFYPQGVRGVGSGRFNSTFEKVFTHPEGYWYSALGNHEWYGNEKFADNNGTRTMIRYTESNSFNRWCLPDYNYTLSVSVDADTTDASFTAKLVFLDTFSIIKANSTQLPEPTALGDISAASQLQWAEEQLCSATDYDWRIVVTHYPIISTGPRIRGSDPKWTSEYINALTDIGDDVKAELIKNFVYDPTEDFRNDVTQKHLSDILKKCGVHAYISGHEHMSQILTKGNLLMMSYGDMGNGNMKEMLVTEPSKTACSLTGQCISSDKKVKEVWGDEWDSVFQHYDGAFGDVTFSKTELNVRTVDVNGVVVNQHNHKRASTPTISSVNDSDDNAAVIVFGIGIFLLLLQQLIFCAIYKRNISPAHQSKDSSVPFTVEMSDDLEASS